MEFSVLGSMLFNLNLGYKDVSNRRLSYREGIVIFLKSSLSGILILLIIESNLLLGVFKKNYAAMNLVSFISGYNNDVPLYLISTVSKMITE